MSAENTYYVYMLRTSINTLYVGQTNNLARRIQQHQQRQKSGAKYLRLCKSFELVFTETYSSRSQALQREAQLKKLTKLKKEQLISTSQICGLT